MRKQRAFATLTEEEIDHIAEWLRQDTYDMVRDRLAKPRPEGFALDLKSTRPLETLWQKKNTVEKINRKLDSGQKLTLAEFESISAGEKPDLPEKIHDAILETAYDRVRDDGNSPFQLLALQKLADFPARAALRARKEARELETREHKFQMDLHRKEMAEHRKQIATERLTLAKQSMELRQKQIATVLSQNSSDQNQKSGIRNPKFDLWSAEDIIHNQPKVEAAIQRDPFLSQIGLPPENPPTPTFDPAPILNLTLPESAPSVLSAVKPIIPEPLESRVNKYTLARHHEALIGKDPTKVGRAAAFNFRSAIEHCPCGNHLPCPDHGDFPRRFFEVMPDDADYFQPLEKKKLPFTPIHQLLRREAEETQPEAPDSKISDEKCSIFNLQ